MTLLRIVLVFSIAAVQSQDLTSTYITFPEDINFFDDRIIQGWPAAEKQFPHQVYLTYNGRFFCGGSLISPRWVLTAGHCIEKRRSVKVHLGEIKQSTPGVTIPSRRLILHPEYVHIPLNRINRFKELKNDIGLIELEKEAQLSDKIRPIRLPGKDGGTFEGKIAIASGWGITDNTVGYLPDALQYVNLTVISNKKCAEVYGTVIVDAVICTENANNPDQATCSGDSGGPLIFYENDGEPNLIGVVSFGLIGCRPPSAYFRPQSYLDWIRNHTGTLEEY